MSHIDLLPHIRNLSGADKFQMMQFFRNELAKQEEIVRGNEVAKIIGSVDTYNRTPE